MKLRIAYFYPELLNLYGDNGNVEILVARTKARGMAAEVVRIDVDTKVTYEMMKDIDIIFMGGGPDSGQKAMYEDLLTNKGKYIFDFIESGGTGLFICGSYQLLGEYYKAADGTFLEGLKLFDLYTEHFGQKYPRCIGNVVARISPTISNDPYFQQITDIGNFVVGFENHGGRTYLKDTTTSFAQVSVGFGNNGKDKTEGIAHKNCIGTYLHGPFLSKNPHIADYLIAKSLKLERLEKLNDALIVKAHAASKYLKQ